MQLLIDDKNECFRRITELKYVIQDNKEQQEKDKQLNENFLLHHKQKIAALTEVVNNHTKSTRKMMSKIEEHELKLNATGSLSIKSPFQLVINSDQFPILKLEGNQHVHFSSLSNMIKKITLHGDDIASVQQFYDAINMAFMTTISSSRFLPQYVKLNANFDPLHTCCLLRNIQNTMKQRIFMPIWEKFYF